MMTESESSLQYLYLTTLGRVTREPREIEIWFIEADGKFYVLAEHSHEAQWVRNITHNPRVHVRVGNREFDGRARVLDEQLDNAAWQTARRLVGEKYGWSEGLPVEIVSCDS
jgi:deazaflavin-dependent oxidoreductase (nitroreductase family)